MEVLVLGSVEAADGDRAIALAAGKQRTLLAALALQAGRAVSVEAIVEQLWDDPPRTADHAVEVYVSTLRSVLPRQLGPHARAPGYILDVPPDCVDALRFERLVRDGARLLAAEDADAARTTLREALALWRGPALADARAGTLRLEAVRLDERRIDAHELCLEAELRLGELATVLEEADRIATEQPLREPPVRLLMLAGYQAGREVVALAAFRRYRRRLDDELGLVPSAGLRALEAAILRHELPRPQAPARRPDAATPRPLHRRLVGRERELVEIGALLRGARGTPVTLAGPGGVGKTTLALALGDELGPCYPGGTVVVRLADLQDAALVVPTIAARVGAAPSSEELGDAVATRLAAAPALVVLDNAEHLPEAAPAIAELSDRSPGSRFLVTSRSPLHVIGERVVRVAPLEVPPAGANAAVTLAAPAVDLLVTRARERGVEVGAPDAPALGLIARRLDGLPLAIELAVARLGVLGVDGLVARLDRALDLLSSDRLDTPARQRTLRAVVEWSERLLDARARNLFATLSVFRGGAPLAAIEQVSGEAEAALLDALAALLDHGLLGQQPDTGGAPRFVLAEPVRAFAAERLAGSGHEEVVCERHAAWIAELAAEAAGGLAGRAQHAWLARLDDELANVRVALRFACAHRPELAARIVVDLYHYWFARGLLREARRLLDAPLAAAASLPHDVWARAAARAAWFDVELGSLEEARELAEAAVDAFRGGGDVVWLQLALGALATVASAHGDWSRAATLNEEVLSLARAEGDARRLAYALVNTAADAERSGDWSSVRALLEEALTLLVRVEDERGVAIAETNLAICRLMDGEDAAAAALAERALARGRRLDLRSVTPYALAVLAIAMLLRDAARAAELALEAVRLAAAHGQRDGLCMAGMARACALAANGQAEAALRAFVAVEVLARDSSLALPPWFHERAEKVVRDVVDDERWQLARDGAYAVTLSEAEAALGA